MHILFTSTWFPNKKSPQNGDFVQRMAKAVALQHQVTFIHVECIDGLDNDEIIENRTSNYSEKVVYIPSHKYRWLNFFYKFKKYNQLIQELPKVDLIHTNILSQHTGWVYYQFIFNKLPFVLSEHWTIYSDGFTKFSIIEKLFLRMFANAAKMIFPVSNHLKNGLINFGITTQLQIIPNVVDIDLFSMKDDKKNEIFQFIHVSSLENEHKNIEGILNVIERLSVSYNFKFTFIGNKKNYINSFIQEKNISEFVTEVSNVPNEAIADYLKQADCFVLFSNYENLPCVILEAFSVGLPVITSNVGGIAEFFPYENGILVEKGNENELFVAMEKVLNRKKIFNSMEIRKYAIENFSYQKVADMISKQYHTILEKS